MSSRLRYETKKISFRGHSQVKKDKINQFLMNAPEFSVMKLNLFRRILQLCRSDGVSHKPCDSHGSHTARNRCDVACFRLNGVKINIAAKLAALGSVYTDVNNDRAVLDHIGCNKFRPADRRNENIRSFCNLFKILRF